MTCIFFLIFRVKFQSFRAPVVHILLSCYPAHIILLSSLRYLNEISFNLALWQPRTRDQGRYCSLRLMTLKLYYDRHFNEVQYKSCCPLNAMFTDSWFFRGVRLNRDKRVLALSCLSVSPSLFSACPNVSTRLPRDGFS